MRLRVKWQGAWLDILGVDANNKTCFAVRITPTEAFELAQALRAAAREAKKVNP